MKRFKNILCVVAAGTDNKSIIERSVILANNNQASLTIVEIVNDMPPTSLIERFISHDDLHSKIVKQGQLKLEELIAPWRRKIRIESKVLIGKPFLQIIREVISNDHDLVIKVDDSCRLSEPKFGSDDMHLLRKCPCPVWLLKSKSQKSYQKIIAAVDVDRDYPRKGFNSRHLLSLHLL